jgi:DNA repair protein RadD
VLDFAGAVRQHGPITNVTTPDKKGKGGEAPIKACTSCFEIVHASARKCPHCGNEFEIEEKPKAAAKLHSDDIMGREPDEMKVSDWEWKKHVSRASGKEMLKVRFYGGLSDKPVDEYLTVLHEGFAGSKARERMKFYIDRSNASRDLYTCASLDDIAERLTLARAPETISFKKNGKFFEVVNRSWSNAETQETTNTY